MSVAMAVLMLHCGVVNAQVVVGGDVYGGGALANVTGNAQVDITKGTVSGAVYGGGLGRKAGTESPSDPGVAALVTGTATVNIGSDGDQTVVAGNEVYVKRVFGCNNANGTPQGAVKVNIYATNRTAEKDQAPYVAADATYSMIEVFGGGNEAHYQPSVAGTKTSVHVYGCYNTIESVYGGGNAANVGTAGTNGAVADTIDGGRMDWVFGGGNGAGASNPGANIYGNVGLLVNAGRINHLFGGSNEKGTISGTKNIQVLNTGLCTEYIGEVFGGNNKAEGSGALTLTLPCGAKAQNVGAVYGGSNMANLTSGTTIVLNIEGGTYDYVYGGSKGTNSIAADIDGDVTLNLHGGTIANAFGGNNVNGNITGLITVNVDSSSACPLRVDNVYGGGNLATYNPTAAKAKAPNYSPVVNLIHGTVGYRSAPNAFNDADPGDHGRVFGAGRGKADDLDAGKVNSNPKVWMKPAAHADSSFVVLNAIYGGGEMAAVNGSTLVQIDNGHVGSTEGLGAHLAHDNGYVFGGGKGLYVDYRLAAVTGNCTVNMAGGYVHNTLFGGGQMAMVGVYDYANAAYVSSHPTFVEGEQYNCTAGGNTYVNISGGQVGPVDVTMQADLGFVFGAGMGYYTQPAAPGYADPDLDQDEDGYINARFGYVNNTYVTISSNAFIVGAVWGGSENGQVLNDCHVTISGGQIGVGKNQTGIYTEEQWTAAKNAVKTYYNTPTPANEAALATVAGNMPECDSWPYRDATGVTDNHGDTYHYLPYDAYADVDNAVAFPASVENYASTTHAGDGHTFFGNVFGGGSGYYPYRVGDATKHSTWYEFQGRVRGDTYLTIEGGHILTSAYGGCEYADVMGDCHVTMSGGTLGVPRTVAAALAHPVTCYLFGAGKGDQRTTFNVRTNVQDVEVTVNGEAFIFGSVFGGGEDGHVIGDATVNIGGNAWIGTTGTSYVDGNIFGGGRGFGGTALTAGSTEGNVEVNISDNCKILGNIYGGGRLASVGVHMVAVGDSRYGYLIGDYSDDDHSDATLEAHGNIVINITGGTIGSNVEFAPAAFSDAASYSIHDIVLYDNDIWRFTAAHSGAWNAAHVTKIDHTTGGNVFGGSMGRLTDLEGAKNHLWPGLARCRSTEVNITGNAAIFGNVYGGGELGYVMKHTDVNIGTTGAPEIGKAIGTLPNVRYTGSVYGGGYGSDDIEQHTNDTASLNNTYVTGAMHAGRVYGNTDVAVAGGHVWGNVYGGGEMASVGRRWINIAANGDADNYIPFVGRTNGTYTVDATTYDQYAWNSAVGNASVTISGGTVGDVTHTTIGTERQTGWVAGKTGGVFGGGKGHPGRVGEDFHFTRMAYVDSAQVNISGGQMAVIFGGSENGHVRYGTYVNMTGGTVGLAMSDEEKDMDPYGYSPVVVFHGNVYGGGRGVDVTETGHLGDGSGQVYGSTCVTISAGTVTHNVYGGGSLATVGVQQADGSFQAGTGKATVLINGTAAIGDAAAKGHNSGRVFGSGRGVAAEELASRAYTNNTYVTIDGTCHVYGCVFGSGENGRVWQNTYVTINGGQIGEDWASLEGSHKEYIGNVYGGGRGIDPAEGGISRTAGLVHGATHVKVTGGKIYHNVFGGGSLANVGDTVELSQSRIDAGEIYAQYYDTVDYVYSHAEHTADGFTNATNNGNTYIYISGGKIGIDGNNNGRVFGGGRGNAGHSDYTPFIDPLSTDGFTSGSVTIAGNSYTIYYKTEGGKVITYRVTNKSEFGYDQSKAIWVLGKERNSTSEPYEDAVVLRDYTNHTYVNSTHVLVDYPSVTTTEVSYPDDRTTLYAVNGSGVMETYNTHLATTKTNTASYDFIRGSVFGGGDNGHVRGTTEVVIEQGRIGTLTGNGNGDVFGGGRGEGLSYDGNYSYDAGKVYGNTNVTVNGGWILHNVYGGGNLSSVGEFTVTLSGAPSGREHDKDAWLNGLGSVAGYTTANGTCTVDINGGIIGEKMTDIMDGGNVRDGMDGVNSNLGGHVFGSSRGQSSNEDLVNRMAYVNNTVVNINSGAEVHGSVFGGGENGHVFFTTNVNISGGTVGVQNTATTGTIYRGNAYGGGRGTDHVGNTTAIGRNSGLILGNSYLTMTGGTVYHHVFGGGSLATLGTYTYREGSGDDKDEITALQRVETGKTEVSISAGTVGINGVNNGSVFGAGRGMVGTVGTQDMDIYTFVDRTYVTISGEANIKGNVYGSGDNGHVLHNTQVVIAGGTIGSGATGGSPLIGNVFGSGRGADTYLNGSDEPTLSENAGRVYGNTDVYVANGIVRNNVYGGGYLASVGGNTHVTIDKQVTVDRETWTFPGMVATLTPTPTTFPASAGSPVVWGDVFGGSALGELGNASGTTTVEALNGTFGSTSSYHYVATGELKGNIFGGGNGDAEGNTMDSYSNGTTSGHRAANVLNAVQVNIGKTTQYDTPAEGPKILGNVFGCNNIAGCPKDDVNVDIYSTYHNTGDGITTGDVYPVTLKSQAADVDVLDSLDIIQVSTANPKTQNNGWEVLAVPARYALTGVYGGGNQASYAPTGDHKTTVTVHECHENTIYRVYGGGKGGTSQAVTHTNADVVIEGGHFYQVFAGGNGEGTGNLGASVTTANVTIKGGVIQNVFGGSNSNGTVTNTSVNFETSICDDWQLIQEVFGGGNRATGNGNIVVNIPCHAKGLKDVYGCSNMADFTGDVQLNIFGSKMQRVFGGARSANINGNVEVNIFAGDIDEVFGGNNVDGYIFGDLASDKGNIVVNIDMNNDICPDEKNINYVYGGGNLAAYQPDVTGVTGTSTYDFSGASFGYEATRVSPQVNVISGTVNTAVFGGGLGATAVVKANPSVVIGADRVQQPTYELSDPLDPGSDKIYTGVEALLTPVSNNTVVIGAGPASDLRGCVLGGGNEAEVSGNTKVNVKGISVVHGHVFGGGNAADISADTEVIIGGRSRTFGNVYGGGNLGEIGGNTKVIVNQE